ncbi:unnamed protein product [Effrenium voratum]|nr:unnamed protein product [Effrenium voratum]
MSKMWLGALVVGGVIYVTLKERILRRFEMKGGRAVPLWLARLVLDGLTCYSSFMGVREVSVGGELNCDRSKKYMIVWHPHGFITWVPFFLAGKYALDAQPAGERWFPVVAPVLFRIPVFGEVLAILGGRRVERKVVEKLLARGDSIAIQPGGVKEQAKTSEVQEQDLELRIGKAVAFGFLSKQGKHHRNDEDQGKAWPPFKGTRTLE